MLKGHPVNRRKRVKHVPKNAESLPKEEPELARVRQDDLVNGQSIQAIFGVAAPTILTWRNQGMPVVMASPTAAPLYHPWKCIKWRRDKDRHDVRMGIGGMGSDPVVGQQYKQSKLKADAERAQLFVEIQRGKLVSVSVFHQVVEMLIGDFTAVAKGQLQQFERDMVKAQKPVDARHLTDRITDELMRGAQRYRETLQKELASGRGRAGDVALDESA